MKDKLRRLESLFWEVLRAKWEARADKESA